MFCFPIDQKTLVRIMEKKEETYDERVKRRVLILKEYIEQGRVKIVENSQIAKSLAKARFDDTGQPDLDTIDGVVRSMALAIEQTKYRNDFKEAISLREIQARYFNYLDETFKGGYDKMIEEKITPHQFATSIAYGERNLKPYLKMVDGILNQLVEFWDLHAEPAYYHLEDDTNSIKAIFGGDFFPSNSENIASKCGIYTDTIVLPCPFIKSKDMFKVWGEQHKVYYLLKHVLNVLQYKTLALADTEKPIIVVLPEKEMFEELEFDQVKKLGEEDSLIHASKIFGRSFESTDELMEFVKRYDSIDKIIPVIKNHDRVLFDIDTNGSLENQLKTHLDIVNSHGFESVSAGMLVATAAQGRMGVCNELLLKSSRLNGIPLIDAPTSWEYFKWKLEYDNERVNNNNIDFKDLHVVKGINQLSETPLQWIGKVPPEGLIELRKSGAINEIRDMLSKGIKELTEENAMDFRSTSHQVFNNINRAFSDHEKNIKLLKNKKWKFAGKDIGSWLVVGTIELTAACTGVPFLGASAFMLNQVTDAPKIKDIPKSLKKLKTFDDDKEKLNKSSIGMIFKYKN